MKAGPLLDMSRMIPDWQIYAPVCRFHSPLDFHHVLQLHSILGSLVREHIPVVVLNKSRELFMRPVCVLCSVCWYGVKEGLGHVSYESLANI